MPFVRNKYEFRRVERPAFRCRAHAACGKPHLFVVHQKGMLSLRCGESADGGA